MFDLIGDREGTEYFSRMSIASHGAERDTGHTGNFFNILWAIPGIKQSGPDATGAWMEEFGAWYFDLARRADGSFVHLGPPGLKHDKYNRWDCTGAYLLSYAMPLKNIYLTGKEPSKIPQLGVAAARRLIDDGRGWSNKDRNSFYDKLTTAQLIERLESWSPTVRERAAMALARDKGADHVPALAKMLGSAKIEARYGACQALAQLRGKSAPAVAKLQMALKADDLWLRIKAAEALASIGEPATPAVPELLKMIARGSTESDPRGMEQRYLSFAVFGKLLKNSLEGVDRDQLTAAVRAGLQNEDGRARGTIGGIYRQLSYDEIKPLLPAIHRAIVEPAPSGIMFASGVRLSGVELLAKHDIREGMELCFDVMEIDKWGKQDRIKRCLRALKSYGAAAKPVLPELHQLEDDLRAHREARNLKPLIDLTRSVAREIESATGEVKLRSLN